jgi:GntR family transcriptional regulator, transcriptional repressor for pyruvate dehydrogenase complex
MASEQIRQQTVVGQVMGEIRGLIASGAYAPGDKIPTEKELAERFGIGRSSVREAIKIFNYLGVLESRAALGTFVRDRSNISAEALSWSLLLGSDELDQLIDLRGGIELWCLLALVDGFAHGAASATGTMAALRQIVEGMESSVKAGRREELIEADFQFHYAIIKGSENMLFRSLYDTLRSFLYGEIRGSQVDYDDPAQICEEHRQLIAAFESGDMIVATKRYRLHIQNIKDRLQSQAARTTG